MWIATQDENDEERLVNLANADNISIVSLPDRVGVRIIVQCKSGPVVIWQGENPEECREHLKRVKEMLGAENLK